MSLTQASGDRKIIFQIFYIKAWLEVFLKSQHLPRVKSMK